MTNPSARPDFFGPDIDDRDTFERLPPALQTILEDTNGFVLLGGGFHLRGACSTPTWHALRRAWEGPMALHRLFKNITPQDIPFAQDAVGDQFILRQGQVHRLWAETGILEDMQMPLGDFFDQIDEDPMGFLDLGPLDLFHEDGDKLPLGHLLHVYPPLCTAQAEEGIQLKAVPADDCINFLADLARQLDGLPEGTAIEIRFK